MVLLSFSEPAHVPLILNGRKRQTTRTERKNPIKPGDTLQVYYKSRVKKGCINCIKLECPKSLKRLDPGNSECHTNFFGTATVARVEKITFRQMTASEREAWARADGFKNWEEAHEWFRQKHQKNGVTIRTGGMVFINVLDTEFDVVYFEPHWLKESIKSTSATGAGANV